MVNPAAILVLAALAVPAFAVEKAPAGMIDAEGVLLLQLINRYRADPPADAARMRWPPGPPPPGLRSDIDQPLFLREMATVVPAPPLLHDDRLTVAARGHAAYLARHRLVQHTEDPALPGFCGERPLDRARAAGFGPGGVGENCAGPSPGIWFAHISFIVDWTHAPDPGNGGMQPGRGHRVSLGNPRFTRVGLGLVVDPEHADRRWVVEVFGRLLTEPRRAGGVVFTDADADGLCDPGEGLAGARVSVVDAAGAQVAGCTTPAHGAWFLDLAGEETLSLRIETGPPAQPSVLDTRELPVALTSWAVTRISPPDALDAFRQVATRLPAGAVRRGALARAFCLADGLALSPADGELLAGIRLELAALDAGLLPLVDGFADRFRGEDHRPLRDEIAALRRRWAGGILDDWGREATVLLDAFAAAVQINSIALTGRDLPAGEMGRLRDRVLAGAKIRQPALRSLYRDLERTYAMLGFRMR
jgi:hypothetical protein